MRIIAKRYHDICCGHRVYGHESKCANLHGHNYRFHFSIAASNNQLDQVGRVLDFSAIKKYLCDWLEINWDHKFLIWKNDPLSLVTSINGLEGGYVEDLTKSFVVVPFNPTAENIAAYFVESIAPALLAGTGVELIKLTIEETRKCSVTYEKEKVRTDIAFLASSTNTSSRSAAAEEEWDRIVGEENEEGRKAECNHYLSRSEERITGEENHLYGSSSAGADSSKD